MGQNMEVHKNIDLIWIKFWFINMIKELAWTGDPKKKNKVYNIHLLSLICHPYKDEY